MLSIFFMGISSPSVVLDASVMGSGAAPSFIRHERDAFLTNFGKKTLDNQYLQKGESYQDLFVRVARAYGDDEAHTMRLYEYMSRLWFMPATPILSNGGTKRGLPISCFLNETDDSLAGITGLWTENISLASQGGGIGSFWGNVRPINDPVHGKGVSAGIIPFIKVMESLTLAISQGSLRRGSAAVYLPISHPEIEEFIELRRPTGGDYNRRALQLHHGVTIPDAFMKAVQEDKQWDLISPATQKVVRTVSARALWIRLLTAQVEMGEPYVVFIDTVNASIPQHHKEKGLFVKTSNLCSEITLFTGKDHLGALRTAVCCLSSLNVEKFLEWKDDPRFIPDCMRFLDNVLTDFIENAPPSMARAVYSASRERSVGLGVMGFHSFLQSQNIPMESVLASVWNRKIFSHIHKQAQEASRLLAEERGPCPDAAECGYMERFSNKIAIAPTASISIICGGTSPGIEPIVANAYTHKTLSGSFPIRNRHLEKLLEKKGMNTEEVWSSIIQNHGSVSHLSCLTDHEKRVYRTAFEMNQKVLVDRAAERQPYVCQSQSLNLFFLADSEKKYIHETKFYGWEKGIKSYYYTRSLSVQRAESSSMAQDILVNFPVADSQESLPLDYNECLSCQ